MRRPIALWLPGLLCCPALLASCGPCSDASVQAESAVEAPRAHDTLVPAATDGPLAGAPIEGAPGDVALVTGVPVPGTPAAGAPAAGAPAADGAVVLAHRVPWRTGERLQSRTRLKLRLEAELGLGLLSQKVTYALEESEVLAFEVLADGADGAVRRKLEFRERQSTRDVPLFGQETKDRRTHGKTFELGDGPAGLSILNASGEPARESVAEEVALSWRVLGSQPVLFEAFPAGEPVTLRPGASLSVEADLARRIVGLPFDELQVDSLQLVLRAPQGEPAGELVFDAAAAFSGATDLGEGQVSLTATLSGTLRVEQATLRMTRLDLEGKVKARQQGEGATLTAKGSGPLVIRRELGPDD